MTKQAFKFNPNHVFVDTNAVLRPEKIRKIPQ